MDRPALLDEMRAFNEVEYLEVYPDVARGIAKGDIKGGWLHYVSSGRSEGRKVCRFNEDFYLKSYALAAREVAAGRVANAFDHYLLFGRGRGYLPHLAAERPRDPSGPASPCGGLWIDAADAIDRVHGRYETGQITETQATNLEAFVRDGYVVLRGGVSDAVAEAACADLDRAYRGEIPGLQFEAAVLGRGPMAWAPQTLEASAKALDIHWFSQSIRKLIFAPAVTEFLALIFESKAFASQTLGFLRGSGQRSHQDSAYVPYTCSTSFAASWIALEDVTPNGGELFYYEGSHRLPDFFYDGKYKSVSEATRINVSNTLNTQIDEHVRLLDENAGRFGLERKRLMARRGDVLIWHADLVHGGDPVSSKITRKSIVTHYCPKHHAPLFCEGRKLSFHEHNGHAFTSSLYPGIPLSEMPQGVTPAVARAAEELPATASAPPPVAAPLAPVPIASAPAPVPVTASPAASASPAPVMRPFDAPPLDTRDPIVRQLAELLGAS